MRPSDPPALLERADAAGALPRLGGMARPNGVMIVSERVWAFAAVDGTILEGEMPRLPPLLQRLPLVRGIARLVLSLAPLFSTRSPARGRERALLAAALLSPLSFVFLPSGLALPAGVALSAALVGWLLRGRALALHGAEHRAIAAAERRLLRDAWTGDVRPSRFSPRCGTNFAAIALPVTAGLEALWPLPVALWTPLVVSSLSLALSMELWRLVQRSAARPLRALLVPGLALQRLTTREPRLQETQTALRAVASVLAREGV